MPGTHSTVYFVVVPTVVGEGLAKVASLVVVVAGKVTAFAQR